MNLHCLGMFKERAQSVKDSREALFETEQSGRARLCDQHTTRVQSRLGDRVEFLGVEEGSRAALKWVNQIQDDYIVGI